MRYTGPAKPISTWRKPLIDYIEPIAFTLGFVFVAVLIYLE